MGAGVEDVLVVWHEIRTGGSAQTGAYECRFSRGILYSHFFDGGCENLIALNTPRFEIALESDCFTVKTPIRLGVIAPKGQLGEVF